MQLVGLIHDMGKLIFLWGDAADGARHGRRAAVGARRIRGSPACRCPLVGFLSSTLSTPTNPRYNASALYYAGIFGK